MAGWTEKQRQFLTACAASGDVIEAYRAVYVVDRMTEEAIRGRAEALLARAGEAERVAVEAPRPVRGGMLTLEAHLGELERLRDRAAAAEKFSYAIQAEVARGKAAGLYGDRSEPVSETSLGVVQLPMRKDDE